MWLSDKENKNDVVRSSGLEHKVNSIYSVCEKFIWVSCNNLKKNSNELLCQPNMLAIIIKRGLKFLKFLIIFCKFQFSSVQSLSRVQFFATSWTAAGQASLSITNFFSLLKLMSIESGMPSNHLLSPSPPAFSISKHQGLLQWVSSSHQVAKGLEFPL